VEHFVLMNARHEVFFVGHFQSDGANLGNQHVQGDGTVDSKQTKTLGRAVKSLLDGDDSILSTRFQCGIYNQGHKCLWISNGGSEDSI
jgi:hypothetical protein